MSAEVFNTIQTHVDSERYSDAIEAVLSALPNVTDEKQKDFLEGSLSSLYLLSGQPQEALKHSNDLPYNRIYALYRLNKPQEALDILKSQKVEDPDFQLLKAQILYKAGDYEACVALYKSFIDANPQRVNDEVYTNYSAALFLSKKYDESIQATKLSQDNTYELTYNAACAAIGNNDFDTAKNYLEFAAKLCRSSLEEQGYSEEEIQDELTSILVQTAYVQQVTGNPSEAARLYNQVISQKPSDAVSLAVAGNNLVSLGDAEGHNIVDIEKKMKLATTSKVEGKLTTWQQRGINLNQTLLLIKKKKFDECRTLLEKLRIQYPESDIPSLVSAAISFTEKNYDEAISSLQGYANQHGADEESILRVQLSLAQVNIFRNNFDAALAILNNLSLKNYPGVVAARVAILRKVGRPDDAIAVLEESIAHWKKDKTPKGESILVTLLNGIAELKIKDGKTDEAIQTYQSMVALDPNNKKFVAGLVQTLASFDLEKAEQYASQLPAIDLQGIDVEKLERESIRALSGSINVSSLDKEKSTRKRRRNKSKNPQPKNFDASKTPDPERWLPKKERTAYKRIHGESRAHQGSSNTDRTNVLETKKGQKPLVKRAPRPGPKN